MCRPPFNKVAAMYFVLDEKEMRFVTKGPMTIVTAYVDVNYPPDHPVHVFELANRAFARYDLFALKKLYLNATGVELSTSDYGAAVQACRGLAERVPVCAMTAMEAASHKPKWDPSKYPAKAPAKPAPKPRGTGDKPAPRPTAGPTQRPKAGTATGRVWEVADTAKAEGLVDTALRAAVIQRCTAEGINASTAQVQFSKWRASQT
ncbi:hypothetical protein [Microcystis phage Me-ZS1]|nr:hypothetical protein [Microcystis phage Me-ZS1]